MKFFADRKVFAAALAPAARIIDRRAKIPILAHVLMRAEGDTVTLTTDSLDMRLSIPLAAEVVEPGATTVPGHLLHDIIKRLPAESRVVTEFGADGRLVVQAARSRFQIPMLPADDFPEYRAEPWSAAFTMDGPALAKAIASCSLAISTDDTRHFLCGIFVHAHNPGPDAVLRFVACDGNRLTVVESAWPAGAEGLPATILPHMAALEVGKLAGGASTVDLRFGRRLVEFGFPGGVVLSSKVIDGTYPDYLRVIPEGNSKVVRLDREVLAEALDRVSLVIAAERKGTKFALRGGKIMLLAATELSQSSEEIDVESEADLEIGFNPRYIRESLDALAGATIEMVFDTPGSPVIMRATDSPATTCVVMPMRV